MISKHIVAFVRSCGAGPRRRAPFCAFSLVPAVRVAQQRPPARTLRSLTAMNPNRLLHGLIFQWHTGLCVDSPWSIVQRSSVLFGRRLFRAPGVRSSPTPTRTSSLTPYRLFVKARVGQHNPARLPVLRSEIALTYSTGSVASSIRGVSGHGFSRAAGNALCYQGLSPESG